MNKTIIKYLLYSFFCTLITLILHFVDQPFWFNENQMLYIFATVAQVSGGLFGLIIAAYTMVDEKFKKLGEDKDALEFVNDIRDENFNTLKEVSKLSITTIVLSISMLALYRTSFLDIVIFLMLESTGVFLHLLYKLYCFIKNANPNKIENKKVEQRELINNEYHDATIPEQEKHFGSFITTYNLLESVLKKLASKLIGEDLSKTQLQILDSLDILKDHNIISQKCYGKINDLRIYRNTLVHSIQNDKNVNPNIYNILDKIYGYLSQINSATDSGKEPLNSMSTIVELNRYIESLPESIDTNILEYIRINTTVSLREIAERFNYSYPKTKREIQKLINYGYLAKTGTERQLKWTLSTPSTIAFFSFNYSDNNGLYDFGDQKYPFTTKWNKASNTSIHIYSDPNNIAGVAKIENHIDLYEISEHDLQLCNFSSRCRTIQIGEIAVWENTDGNYLLTLINNIQDDTRGDEFDLVTGMYRILKVSAP